MQDSFSKFHPIVNFIYFAAVVGFSMFVTHPVFLIISLVTSITYSFYLSMRSGKGKWMLFSPLMILPVMIFNVAFNHSGATILAYFPSGNPLTLESVIYGIAAACLMINTLLWFICFTKVVNSDKFVYLFGRIIPSLSLVISMALRFVPRFINQFKAVNNAEKIFGRDITSGSVPFRIKNAARVLSITVSWALENAVETSDSMKSRGYGLPGRTAFSIYHFEMRDAAMLAATLLLSAYTAAGLFTESLYYTYFPFVTVHTDGPYSVSVCLAYFMLCALPMIINLKEEIKWKSLKSKI